MVIGLTGNIGSGKSTVAKIFETLGCKVFDSDTCAKKVYFNELVKKQILNLLGKEVYLTESEIDKKYISSKIFSNKILLEKINSIIHPVVKSEFEKFIDVNQNKIIIKESALLFEVNLTNNLDKLITVVADENLRLSRVMKRDGIDREMALKKINSQMPQELKASKSNFVITNNEDELLIPQVISVYESLMNKKSLLV